MESGLISDKRLLATFSMVSLITMGLGFYKVLKRGQQSLKEEPQELEKQEEEINKQLDKLNSLQALLADKAENIEKKYMRNLPHILTADCLKEILQFTLFAVDPQELQKIYLNSRKARRSCFNFMKDSLGKGPNANLENYYRFVCTFEEQIQYLIEKSQKDFVVFLDIDYSTITDSIDYHNCQTDSDFAEWVKEWSDHIKDDLREKLPLYAQPVDPQKILEIVKYEIQVLAGQAENLKKTVEDLSLQTEDEQEAIPTFLQVFLEDIIHEKYGVQIEQTNLVADDLTPELRQKMHVLSELQNSVLRSMTAGEEGYSEEQQSQGEEQKE